MRRSIELDLLGSRFSVVTNDETWAAFLRQLWGGFETAEPGTGRPVEIEAGPGTLRLTLPGQATLDFEDPWTLAEVLRYWLAEDALKETSGLVLIHAATVVRDGAALLLVGSSGAGKTSMTLALLAEGWSLGSDDVAPLDPATGLIRPFPKPLGIREPQLWRALGRTDFRLPWDQREGSPVLLPPSLFDRAETPFEGRWIAFIDYDPGAEALLEPLTGARTTQRLVEHTRVISPEAVKAAARLSASARAAAVTYPSSTGGVALLERLTTSEIHPKTG